MKKLLYSIVVFFLIGNLSAQSIEKQWVFNYIHSDQGTSLFEIDQRTDTFTLNNGAFEGYGGSNDQENVFMGYSTTIYEDAYIFAPNLHAMGLAPLVR